MRKGAVFCAALLLSACSSTIDNTYYQLPSKPAAMQVRSGGEAQPPALWVQQVAVPDYLAGNGLVYQTSDVKYVIAANNLWASPLDQQLQQTLVANLSKALPGRLVSAAPLGEKHDTLSVTVTGFQGRFDGRAVVSGEWILQHNGHVVKQGFDVALPQNEDGYDALVRTLAIGWQQTAQNIANAVITTE